MTETNPPRTRFHPLPWSTTLERVRSKDPGGLALKRSVRAAIIVTLVFGLTHLIFSDGQISLFGAFGSFADRKSVV